MQRKHRDWNKLLTYVTPSAELPHLTSNDKLWHSGDISITAFDALGLIKGSLGGTGSFFFGGVGGSATIAAGIDSDLNLCGTVTVCGRVGVGASTGARLSISGGEGTFYPNSDTGSLGAFAAGGFGPFASFSTRTDKNLDTTVTGSFGVGGGASAGAQFCNTKTICF